MNNELPAPVPHIPAPPAKAPERTSTHKDGLKNILTTILIIIAAPILALLLTSFVFQSYQVYGPSMETTMQNGDRLIVVKANRTWAKIRNKPYIPSRSDIIIFTKLDLLVSGEHGGNKQLIKRVMALPGERVVVKDGVLIVYNNERPEGFQPDVENEYGKAIKTTSIDGEWTVGENEVFVAGDNRGNSLDSRTFGPIDVKDIVGTAKFRFLPTDQARSF